MKFKFKFLSLNSCNKGTLNCKDTVDWNEISFNYFKNCLAFEERVLVVDRTPQWMLQKLLWMLKQDILNQKSCTDYR